MSLLQPIHLGPVTIDAPVILAPMTGASMVTGPRWMGCNRLMGGRSHSGAALGGQD